MKQLHFLTLCLFLSVSYVIGDEAVDHKNKTTTTPAPSPSTTNSTTTIAPSTTATPSTTTPVPTTPSTPTTAAPTTPTPTTPTPTTTNPTVPPSPSPSTTPAPPAKDWIIIDPVTHQACIMAAMTVTFKLQAANLSHQIKIDPASAHVDQGKCGNTTQDMLLVWPFSTEQSSMLVTFSEKDKNYFVSGMTLNLAYNSSEGIKAAHFSFVNLTLFETSVNSSYSCASVDIPEKTNDMKQTVDIVITDLHVEAFKTGNSTSFNSTFYCSPEVPDIVPVVVGILLAVLVLVVVIAYLIGRRRSQASGYLSM